MAINVFSGARRISAVIAPLWILVLIYVHFDDSLPLTKQIQYTIDDPKVMPSLVLVGGTGVTTNARCSPFDYARRKWWNTVVFRNDAVEVTVCFKRRQFGDQLAGDSTYIGYLNDDSTIGQVTLDKNLFSDSLWNAGRSYAGRSYAGRVSDAVEEVKVIENSRNRFKAQRYIDRQIEFVKQELEKDSVVKAIHEDARKEQRYRRKDDVLAVLKILVYVLVVIYSVMFVIGWIVRGFLGIPTGTDFKPPPHL